MNEIWSDTNRFNQSGYSASTIFPKRENYLDETLFNEDLELANLREESHQDWLEEERRDYRRNTHDYFSASCREYSRSMRERTGL